MDAKLATDIMAANKGHLVTVLLTDDTRHDGLAISVNSKGVNIAVDGKTRSFSLTRVADLIVVDDLAPEDIDLNFDEPGMDLDIAEDDDLAAEIAMTGNFDANYMDGVDATDDSETGDADTEEYGDGLSTAEVAAIVGLSPKELRVILRRLGMGVGKGRQYGLDTGDVIAVKREMAKEAAAANADN